MHLSVELWQLLVLEWHGSLDMKIVSAELEHHDDTGSKLLVNGRISGDVIEGSVVELCLEHQKGFLVFLTDGIPHEDFLNIHLLDNDLRILDSVRIGSMYSTGSFSAPNVLDDKRVAFEFIGDYQWYVTILSQPEFRVPMFSSVKGVSRKYLFKEYFRVEAKPK